MVEIDSETLPAATGTPTASSTFTVTYAKQPTHPDSTYTAGALAVKRLAAEGISFNGVSTSQLRHVYYPKKVTAGSVNKLYYQRKDITCPILDTDVATLYGKMGCTETIVNSTHSHP